MDNLKNQILSKKDYNEIPSKQSEIVVRDNFQNKNILERRQQFSTELKNAIKQLAFDPKNVVIYGTGSLKSLYYSSGDIDLIQNKTGQYKDYKTFYNFLLKVLDNIDKDDTTYFLEIKSGIDADSLVDIGYIDTTQINMIDDLSESINNYNYNDIVRDMKHKKMDDILHYVKKKPSFKDWLQLYEQLRLKWTLRWTMEEVRKGYKMGRLGNKITFKETLYQPAFTKIDTIKIVDDRIISVDMTYYLSSYSVKTFNNSLLVNMFRMYYDGKYVKVIKRLLAYYRIFKKDSINEIIDLWKFLITYDGLIKVKSYTDILIEFINKSKFKYSNEINRQLNNVITFIGLIDNRVYPESQQEKLANEMRKLIAFVNNKKEKQFDSLLIKVLRHIDNFLNKKALNHLKQYNFIPFKKEFIPSFFDSIPADNNGKIYSSSFPKEYASKILFSDFPKQTDVKVDKLEPPQKIY